MWFIFTSNHYQFYLERFGTFSIFSKFKQNHNGECAFFSLTR
eukprot:UN05142